MPRLIPALRRGVLFDPGAGIGHQAVSRQVGQRFQKPLRLRDHFGGESVALLSVWIQQAGLRLKLA